MQNHEIFNQLRIHWFYTPTEPTTKLISGRVLLIKTPNQSRNRWKVIGNGLLLHWMAKETAPQAVLELLSANHTKMQHMDVSLQKQRDLMYR